LTHLLVGLVTVYARFGRLNAAQRQARIRAWSRRMLQLLGIELQLHGVAPAHGPLLIVANHISWLDITVLHSVLPCRFVSKADIRHWPVIGRLATACDTLYIERESRRDAMRVVHNTAEALRAGGMVAVFPEGTTSNGDSLLPFHANLVQAAISADVPVQPLAIRFTDPSGVHTTAPSYVGDDSLATSVWRTVRAAPLVAHVWVGGPQRADGRDRRAWSQDLRQSIEHLRR
jgi:1-acyl-sn-glycerol-3-phosphate acyltransferase